MNSYLFANLLEGVEYLTSHTLLFCYVFLFDAIRTRIDKSVKEISRMHIYFAILSKLFRRDIDPTLNQKGVLYCIVLYCIVLYCIVLYCIVLYCIVLYCIVLYCIVLYCIVLYCIVLYCIVLYCIVLYCIVLYCIVLYCIVLYCIVLYYIITDV